MKNIEQQLQQALYECQQLKKENLYFKALLEKYRIPYDLKSSEITYKHLIFSL